MLEGDPFVLRLLYDRVEVLNRVRSALRDDLTCTPLSFRRRELADSRDRTDFRSLVAALVLTRYILPPANNAPLSTPFNVTFLASSAGH